MDEKDKLRLLALLVEINRKKDPANLMRRTKKAVRYNTHIKKVGDQLLYDGKYPVVTSETRNFNQMLVSAGTSDKREAILLDPNSERLKLIYKYLHQKLKNGGFNTKDILQEVLNITKTIFSGTEPEPYVEQQKLSNGRVLFNLDDFIDTRQGVCRHHALLNAYLLSRLVEDKVLNGDVIHHRQDLPLGAAHAWNLFRDSKDGKFYSLDSLWDELIVLGENNKLDNRYCVHGLEKALVKRYTPTPANNDKKQVNYQAMHDNLKDRIERDINKFRVGYSFFSGVKLTLEDGTKKRVPHRVRDIYILLTDKNQSAEQCWLKVLATAQTALDKPRPGRQPGTTAFYQSVVDTTKPIIDTPQTATALRAF